MVGGSGRPNGRDKGLAQAVGAEGTAWPNLWGGMGRVEDIAGESDTTGRQDRVRGMPEEGGSGDYQAGGGARQRVETIAVELKGLLFDVGAATHQAARGRGDRGRLI